MEFTFLGTSAGTPTKARNVTGLALRHGSPRQWYLIDCGEGTQQQLLRTRYSPVQLQAIFITHVHGDHTFGLPGLLASASMAGRTEPLPIIAPASLRPFIEVALSHTDSNLGYELEFIDSEAPDFRWQDQAVAVTAATLSHRVPCRAFVFTENNLQRRLLTDALREDGIDAGPVWGQLQQGQDVTMDDGKVLRAKTYTLIPRTPRRIVVAGDNDTPELLADACQNAHVLIHEATYTQAVSDRIGPWPQHSSAAQVARFADAIGVPNLVLTHFSSRYQFRSSPQTQSSSAPNIEEVADEARSIYRGNLCLAQDFAGYRLTPDFVLELMTE
ncbi:ribonuclease Z [Marinobacter caseinilyticus]|uniref:ribonuclease Z n=1 Tax=Marinobacter caseinilyticus TaxID=2692195 RepID=UPI00140A4A36|nr:ribonuclease Z [Marinobacter caseinilyticus]